MDSRTLSSIFALTAYAPIALFAESLCVQRAMVASILSPRSIAPAITGCVKDLYRLWHLDDIQLFGSFEDQRTACVASVKHGNSFPLHNQTVLLLAGVLRRKLGAGNAITPHDPTRGQGFPIRRETIVNLSFVLPHQAGSERRGFCWLQCVCWGVTLVEIMGPTVMAAHMVTWGDAKGVFLMAGFSSSVLILAMLRFFTHPVITKQTEISKLRKDVARGVSTLDVHIIADDWNSKHLDVVCGYSSHLHAMTNIPMVISRPRLLLWASRALAVVLLVQAASLASLIGKKENSWLSLTWLAMYIVMLIPPRILSIYRSESTYESYMATLDKLQPIHFSSRRAALVFISLLPASKQAYVEEWDWMNVFMPDNERRRKLKAHINSLDPVTLEKDPEICEQIFTEEAEAEYQYSKDLLREASAAYHDPRVLQHLLSYKTSVGLQKV